ncbi:SDR family NAD(P)-dependent oxidoreductase [Paraburkholderia sp. ZP32-5]|uniref:SDR family NAD(P)-dependent oxidoreductase n=1 Tax=Paraburkholderia sp. ZP32-5 TaxID=2883245 RepID=UPI001F1779AC|nr:SDR family oxidoreductase [Paraburkholderia sp. ZP32-5]
MKNLAGKTAIVTGGNSGIGFAIAKTLIENGADVMIVGRRADAVDAAVRELGPRAIGLTGDVADLATHDRVAALAAQKFGGVDIYVANAGINMISSSQDVSVADYDAQFSTNTRSVFFGVQKISAHLRNAATVLLVSSVASSKVMEGHAAYAGSKAAIEAFARAWALEFKQRAIRVNVLSPGPVDTPILSKLGIPADARKDFEVGIAAAIPLGRLGHTDELARAALFLVSSDSSFITGVNLAVDGGISLT